MYWLFAKKTLDQDRPLTLEDENGYTFLGLISMIDPPRGICRCCARLQTSWIKAIMITGDHKITASSIARQIGIFNDGDRSLDGVELDQMSDGAFGDFAYRFRICPGISGA